MYHITKLCKKSLLLMTSAGGQAWEPEGGEVTAKWSHFDCSCSCFNCIASQPFFLYSLRTESIRWGCLVNLESYIHMSMSSQINLKGLGPLSYLLNP